MFGRRRYSTQNELACSFCNKSQGVVGKLISSPSDYHRAYICDECIAVCTSILEDDRPESELPPAAPLRSTEERFLDHPLRQEFFLAVERWLGNKSESQEAQEGLASMRVIANQILAETESDEGEN